MNFFKHVGECNGKKVVIVQRQLPGEDHMAGIIYSEIIPSRFHDDLMKVLESTEGQAANEFKDVLMRRMSSNGENMLEQLYAEGYIKKAAANNIIIKPNSKSAVRLDELNKLLTQINTGQLAAEQLSNVTSAKNKTAVAEPAGDSNALMAQMMAMMQTMQAELTALKSENSSTVEPTNTTVTAKKNSKIAKSV